MISKIRNSIILKKISLLFIGRVYSILIGMISSVVMVRYLKPELNGVYNYAIAYVAIFSGIALMGLDNVVIKEFARKGNSKHEVFTASILVRLLGTSIAFLVILLTMIIGKVTKENQLLIWIAALPCIANIFSGVSGWFYARTEVRYIVISQSIAHTICLFGKMACVYIGLGVAGFLVVTSLETFVLILLQWLIFKNRGERVEFSFNKTVFMYLLRQGWPICLGSIAYTVFMKIDQIMIGKMISNYELGIYSVAVKIAELWYFVPNTIVVVLLPKLTEYRENGDYNKFYGAMQKYMSWLVLLGYISSGLTMVFGKMLIWILYGEEYLGAYPILCIYIWAGIFINMSVLRGNYFVLMECTQYSFWTNLSGAIVNIFLNIVLIQKMGSIGAAFATFISYGVYAYISSMIIPRLRKMGGIQTKALLLSKIK